MRRILFLFLTIIFFNCSLDAQLRLSKLISDHAVLQRGTVLPVWGWAAPGEAVTVSFQNQKWTARANRAGEWSVQLPPMEAGGPYELNVKGTKASITVRDLLIGDVWVCSGQSNMEWSVANSANAKEEIARASDPLIRHFKVPREGAYLPQDTLPGGAWEVCSPATVAGFTAVGYYFARELRRQVDVPIGLLNSSWGGSRIEPWMSAQTLGYTSAEKLAEQSEKEEQERLNQLHQRLTATFGSISEGSDRGMKGGTPIWADYSMPTSNWPVTSLPGLWEEQEDLKGLDGVVWYQKAFELKPEQTTEDVVVSLGKVDDDDQTYLNGHLIGSMENSWNKPRVYSCHKEYLRSGKNVLTVRVVDHGGGGGIYGAPEALYIQTAAGKVPLSGQWKFMLGRYDGGKAGGPRTNQIPTMLYNAMIYPALDFRIKGALWYQGESNAGNAADAFEYRERFQQMIRQWRSEWNSGEFPFLYVQLANFMQARPDPQESFWATLRESQSKALGLPNTAQAVIIDIGEAEDIHPRNKQDVGLRLSLAARKLAYNQEVVHSGPVFQSMEVKDGKVILTFDQVGSGLLARDKFGYLKEFAIAGKDKKFVWAKAEVIAKNKVAVWNDAIKTPLAVRYAWADNPDQANLYNEEGLPASPFRTDEW